MKYKDLIQFEPINEVVKFDRLMEDDYRRSLVRNFVFSSTYENTLIPELCKNLDYTASHETYGLQIVGNYGTGKSHLMSLFSLVAENAEYLPLVQNDSARKVLGNIAGKYKIIRFELGSDDELWRIVCYQIDQKLKEWNVNYSISEDKKPDMYADKLSRLMAHFEEVYPDKGLMIVIDEMLSYLKGRATDDRLNRDLAVLQALGQMSDHSKFRMVFGVQELIYNTPQFQFAADMLGRVNDRFRQITITKQDVQFVVQQRLLHKSDAQKETVRKHLSQFTAFFTDMHAHLEDYVNLFPVNPSFFDNFQQIKVSKSQREVMKTLTRKFEAILDTEVPESHPGLICYDHYWEDLNVPSMMTEPDVRRVSEIMNTVHQKIDENLTGGRAKKAPLAHRIANACAVKILQDSLDKTNGVNVDNLIDDLCYLDDTCLDRDFLKETINMVAKHIVTSTDGQYFEKNETNQEYHLRIEGGVNYEQKIKDFVATMTDDVKDSHFFNFLVEYLPIDVEQYRREFKIFSHRIDWKSHKTMLDGYIFMGNPTERSTTQPQQNFYIYFMPIFNKANMKHGDEADSIYVHLDKVSDEMKELVELYAAAEAQIASSDSSQKPFYQQYKKRYEDKLKTIFQQDFMQCTEIYYQGELQTISPQIMTGGSREQIISNIASILLEDYFCQKLPDYPKFSLLRSPLTTDNRAILLKSARQKIANPSTPNQNGEAILAGLGLLQDNQLSVDSSIYAISLMNMLENKGVGQVLNKDEILHRFYESWDDDWRSTDYGLDADLEFIVLSAMVALGQIEINLPGGVNINAANLKDIIDLPRESFYSFSHICRPKGMDKSAVRELFLGIVGKDMTSQLQNADIYPELVANAKQMAANAVNLQHAIKKGIYLGTIEIRDEFGCMSVCNRIDSFVRFCDRVQTYATPVKMRNLPWKVNEIKQTLEVIKDMNEIKQILKFVDEFKQKLSYLDNAIQYMTSDDMKARTTKSLNKIQDVIDAMSDEKKVKAYSTELDKLINDYADWYLAEYRKFHITALEDDEKRRIMNSNEKKICEAICEADHANGYFSVAPKYKEWTKKMSLLSQGNPSVNKDSLLRSPYYAFNPTQMVGKELPKLAELKDELNTLFGEFNQSLLQTLQDQTLLANKDILDSSEQGLLNRFNTKGEELSITNAARLVDIIIKLSKGIHKIPTSIESLRTVFNRPMTPDDAIKAFRQYINTITGGSKDENIRIILN